MIFTLKNILERRKKVAQVWNTLLSESEVVVIDAGVTIYKPGRGDQVYPFLPHPRYFWLTGRRREGEVVVYSKELGWKIFSKEIAEYEAVWSARKDDILVEEQTENIKNCELWLQKQKFSRVYRVNHIKDISGKAFDLRTSIDTIRRKKDSEEIALIKKCAQISRLGFKKIQEILVPGISEKELQMIYETAIFKHGAHGVPYDTIVGSGQNSSILHALPTKKIIQKNEFVLIDAGVEMYDYCTDITRTFYTGKLTGQHQSLYEIVQKAHDVCIESIRVGVEWRDIHTIAARIIADGLHQLGILKGNSEEILESGAISLFFPHGVGHLVGLGVRDTSQEENTHPKTYCGARLRIDLALEENHLVTVEPGCYFIPALLDNKGLQKKFKKSVNWDIVEKWRHIGGVRIEDDVLVKKDGYENLTEYI